jgi:GT2 family glycosyltransferase
VHPAASPHQPRSADPGLDIDILRDDITGAPVHVPGAVPGTRRVRVRVHRDGLPQSAFTIHNGGSRVSTSRLVREVVTHLGPALLLPGLSWEELQRSAGGGSTPLSEALTAGLLRSAQRLDPSTTISVLMATRDRPGPLRRSLEALIETSPHPLQIVLVDNSPDPTTTRRVVEGLPGVKVVHEPWPGLSPARNAGLPFLTGDIVVFVDDDVVTTPQWLQELLAPFVDPFVGLVTGNVLPANLELLNPQVFEDYGGLGRGPHRRTFDQAWLRSSRGPAHTWEIGATANAAVRRDVLAGLGPFDEALGPGRPSGIGEDTEYFYRVLNSGWTVAYQPTAVVLHHHRDTRESLLRQMAAYSSGHVAYHLQIAARHSDLRGVGRLVSGVPRYYVHRAVAVARGDDYPADVLATEVRNVLRGPCAWWRSRRELREAGRPVPR